MSNSFADIVRAITRPIVTAIFAAVIAQVVVEGITVPDWFIYGLAMPCILWWFGERMITHAQERRTNGKTEARKHS